MFKFLRNNKIVPKQEYKSEKILINSACPKCGSEKFLGNDEGSLSKCLNCGENVTLFDNTKIKKDTFNNFIKNI